MESQKADTLLNLALNATEREREKSEELDVGYNPIGRSWEVIVKYSGDLARARELANEIVELHGGFAIITIDETRLEALFALPEIEYVEKPKSLYFQVVNGRRVSCINAVQDTPFSLSGEGVIVAVVDSGIDYESRDFRNPDGSTRILALWDQTVPGNPPAGYAAGTEFTREEIDEALAAAQGNSSGNVGNAGSAGNGVLGNVALAAVSGGKRLPTVDNSGHGTGVAGIAAGNGAMSGGVNRGVAPKSDLLVVKMGLPRENGFPRTTELMQGLDYVIRKAQELRKPVAVNVSFGNTYGSHDGSSLVERFIDNLANVWKNVICVGSGNEAFGAGHTSGVLTDSEEEVVSFSIQSRQPDLSIQIWKEYEDSMDISLISPSGVRVGPIKNILGPQRFVVGSTEILLYYGEPNPFSTAQEIYLSFLPRGDYLDSGIWRIVLTPTHIVQGQYEMWMPGQQVLNRGTGFLNPTADTTLTIPSTAAGVITVGAYDALTFAYADFSGRGYTRVTNQIKPDIVAPGVDVTTVQPGGIYAAMTGTSFAAPFATGGAALLMEWGIVKGNDPYLYGAKVKAYFRRGARELPEFNEYPNPYVGYGEDVIIRSHR